MKPIVNGRLAKDSDPVSLGAEDLWVAAAGARLLQEFEAEGADLLAEFEPKRLATTLRRKLTSAQRSHLDYVVKRILEWRTREADYEGEMPWDPDEPWTGPTYDARSTQRTLERAIRQHSDVEMDYFTHARGEFTMRRVTPREIDGRYLIGLCHLRNDERTFRVERIARIRILGKAGR